MVTADLRAENDVVHIVDNMLGNGESQPARAESANFSKPDASAVQAASKLVDAEFLDASKASSLYTYATSPCWNSCLTVILRNI